MPARRPSSRTIARLSREAEETAPLFQAITAEARQFLWSLYAEFVGRFRDAAEKLRVGGRETVFLPGCFPPGLPYVPG